MNISHCALVFTAQHCIVAHRLNLFPFCLPQGWPWVSKEQEKPTDLEYMDFRRNREVQKMLEAQNVTKTAKFHKKAHF